MRRGAPPQPSPETQCRDNQDPPIARRREPTRRTPPGFHSTPGLPGTPPAAIESPGDVTFEERSFEMRHQRRSVIRDPHHTPFSPVNRCRCMNSNVFYTTQTARRTGALSRADEEAATATAAVGADSHLVRFGRCRLVDLAPRRIRLAVRNPARRGRHDESHCKAGYKFGKGIVEGQRFHGRSAWRQRRRSGGDDPVVGPRASRLHGHHRRVSLSTCSMRFPAAPSLKPELDPLPRCGSDGKRRQAALATPQDPAARQRALRRSGLHAGHDGHRAERRPHRRRPSRDSPPASGSRGVRARLLHVACSRCSGPSSSAVPKRAL